MLPCETRISPCCQSACEHTARFDDGTYIGEAVFCVNCGRQVAFLPTRAYARMCEADWPTDPEPSRSEFVIYHAPTKGRALVNGAVCDTMEDAERVARCYYATETVSIIETRDGRQVREVRLWEAVA